MEDDFYQHRCPHRGWWKKLSYKNEAHVNGVILYTRGEIKCVYMSVYIYIHMHMYISYMYIYLMILIEDACHMSYLRVNIHVVYGIHCTCLYPCTVSGSLLLSSQWPRLASPRTVEDVL